MFINMRLNKHEISYSWNCHETLSSTDQFWRVFKINGFNVSTLVSVIILLRAKPIIEVGVYMTP